MTVQLGFKANSVKILLSRGESWTATIEPTPGSTSPVYAVGTTIVACLYPADTDTTTDVGTWTVLASWAATIVGDNVIWNEPASAADAIPTNALVRIRLTYPDATGFLWGKGVVARDD